MAEIFASAVRFKTLKSALDYLQTFQSRVVAKQAFYEYVEICGAARRYNRQRRHSALGHLSPFEYYSGQLHQVA
ncbi:IS3 family transposase [Spirosoma agri]|uniref:IS3 family transposase n=1 Tax=Spirosoma agri TaxID=1987381 RepID=A0A6M0IGM2_9BACT|nr:IS3 family transposase [Spirosoma agri]